MAIFVILRPVNSLPREHINDWLRAHDTFLAANSPPWDDLTEVCDHGQFSAKAPFSSAA